MEESEVLKEQLRRKSKPGGRKFQVVLKVQYKFPIKNF